jgi:hypothetical protein
MPEACGAPQSFSRKACLADFLDDDDDDMNSHSSNYKQDRRYSNRDDIFIAKNQQEFGHRKRIKP